MLDITHGLPKESIPRHYIEFGLFDSRRFKLNLHQRVADTPSEKEITTSIPYMQGIVDMSNAIGNRIYENREITYTFYRFGVKQDTARDFQTTIENLLMGQFDTRLDDSYEPDFHYMGKCQSVVVTDDYQRNRLRIEVTFDLYPFKIDNHMESADLFDSFNFDLDAFQNGLAFQIGQTAQTIHLYNTSQLTLSPWIETQATGITFTMEQTSHSLRLGRYRYPNIRLKPGLNALVLQRASAGTTRVSFDWRKERI